MTKESVNNSKIENCGYENLRKKPSRIKREFGRGISNFVVLAAVIILAFLLFNYKEIFHLIETFLSAIAPLIYGLAFAYLINPLMKQFERLVIICFEKKVKNKVKLQKAARVIGIFLALTVILAILAIVLNMVIPELYKSIRSLIYVLPSQMKRFTKAINSLSTKGSLGGTIATYLKDGIEDLQKWLKTDLSSQLSRYMGYVSNGVRDFLGVVVNILVGLIMSIYILNSKEKLSGQCKKVLFATTRTDKANFILGLVRKANEIFGGFLIGKIIDSIIVGVLCFIGISLFGITERYALLVSVIIGVTNVIPFFGPYLGAVPSAILIMLENPLHGLYFIIFIIVLQQFDGNVLGAKILGNSTGLSSLWVIFAIITGGSLFGFIGMVIGVPTFAVIYFIFKMIVDEKLKKKNLPAVSNEYIDVAKIEEDTHELCKIQPKEKKKNK